MGTLATARTVALLVICVFSSATAAQNRFPKSSSETRKLLAALSNVRIDSDKLGSLFRVGNNRTTDLIRLLDDPDREISLRAQVIIRYLGSEAGMRALRAWYSKQQGGYRIAGPVPQPLDEWDYNYIKLNLIGNSPRTWGDEGVRYVYALALDDAPKARTLLAELISAAIGLDEASFVGNAIRRVQTSKPSDILVSGKDLGKQVLNNAFFVAPEDRKYTSARVLALNEAKDKALIEVYINRGTLAEEWYHVVLKRCDQGWQFFSVTPVAVS